MMKSSVKMSNTSNIRRNGTLSFSASVIITIVGLLISQPFFWVVMILGHNFHYITFPIIIMIVGFIVGAPMFLFGVISLLRGNHPVSSSSTADIDLGRIRYETERK